MYSSQEGLILYSKHLFNEQTFKKHEANTTVYIFVSPSQQILATILQDVQAVMTWGIFRQISVSIYQSLL